MATPLKNRGFVQSLFKISATPLEILGRVRYTDDGRKFRYCKAGASALAAGKLNVAEATSAYLIDEACPAVAVAIGEKVINFTLGGSVSVAENQLAGGYLQINDDTAEGTQYLIEANSAVVSATAITVTLREPIRVALGAGSASQYSLIKNSGFQVVEQVAIGLPVGVAPVAVTASYYFWNQCGGVANTLMASNAAIGTRVIKCGRVAGSVTGPGANAASIILPTVGVMIETGVDTEYKAVRLMLG